jgi:polysaccharide pyruvyl transferase WcaK-like protein
MSPFESPARSPQEEVSAETAALVRIGLLWHSASSGNLGVGALTIANLAIIRQVAINMGLAPVFTIMGMREPNRPYLPEADAGRYAIDTRRLLLPSGFWAAVAQQDCVFDIGAGDSFTEIYGPRRFAFLWLTKMMTSARAKPLLLSPQTIGPFRKGSYRLAARLALSRAVAVVVRDEMSLRALQELAPRAPGALSVDVAFALPYADRSAMRGEGCLKVGVNVSGLLFNEAESGRNRFGLSVDYAVLMRNLIRDLAGQPGVEVHLVTHALHATDPWDDDGRVADKLSKEFPQVIRVPDFSDPSEAKSYISGLDFLIAGRMHACIAAYSAGTPVVPVAYSRKFTGLFGMLGYKWLVPVNGVSGEEAHAFLLDCIERRAELAQDMTTGMSKVEALLEVYRAEVRSLLAGLRPR